MAGKQDDTPLPGVKPMPAPPDSRVIGLDRQAPLTHQQVESVRFGLGDTGPLAQAVMNSNVAAATKQIFNSGVSCLSDRRPSDPVVGQMIFETDTQQVFFWTGTAWVTPANATPTGSMQAFAGAAAPTGWLLCNGASYAPATYPSLYAVLGVTYGGVLGTSFNVPDLKGRAPVGKGANLAVDTLNKSDLLADASRNPNHAHTIAHTHTMANHTHQAGGLHALWIAGGGIMYWQQSASVNWNSNLYAGVGSNVGGGGNFNDGIQVGGNTAGPSNNTTDGSSAANSGTAVQPFLVTNYIIKT